MHSLKYFRNKTKMTQCQLAEKSGLSQAYINELENGRKLNPSYMVLTKLADALGISTSELFMDKGKAQ